MRRLLGPVGGPFMFFLIAALVFAGLGWVTVVALRVEQAQREAAAQAELGNNLRVALWRLDGRMLPSLGVEDSRPFYHYTTADPLSGSTAGPTPLLAAPLPEWMKIHVQLDPVAGWDSPQVLTPEAADRVSQAWPDLPLRNNTTDRAAILASIRDKYSALGTCELLAAREQATPSDGRPFAAPLVDPQPQSVDAAQSAAVVPPDSPPKPPPPVELGRTNTAPSVEKSSETFRLFGWELPRRDTVASNLRHDENQLYNKLQKDSAPQQPAPPAPSIVPGMQTPVQKPAGGAVGRTGIPPNDNVRQWLEYRNRMGTIARGVQEAKNAGLEYPQYNRGQGNLYQQNFANPSGDGKTNPTTNQAQLPSIPVPAGPAAPVAPTTPPALRGSPTGPPTVPAPPLGYGPGYGNKSNDKLDRDGKRMPGVQRPAAPTPPFGADTFAKKKDEAAKDMVAELLRGYTHEQYRGTLTEHLATLGLGLERRRCLDEIQQGTDGNRKQFADAAAEDPPAVVAAWAVAACASAASMPRLVAPAEERPVPAFQNTANALTNNTLANNTLVGPPGVNIHLGSMRPQWITAADGTETLVLVRAVKIDNKTVYQGVVLDWAKLQQLLRDEVKDLFPDATLVPVKDASGVSPDRAMTALPVQLEPGAPPALPPTGWTPLRFGLVLAWLAALVAFAAVGLSGWSLIDLAERRIRFVSAVTHELRTPLTSLRLYLDLLMSGMIQDEAKKQEYLNTLATESDRLHRLIDNVLDFAKLERRARSGTMKPVKVGELITQLQQTWTDRVGADGKELVVISTLSAELEVSTDAAMVYQIVGNLIDNARKYTRDAEDKRIWLWAKPGGNGRIVFEVEDRGAGVPQSERKTIFKPFRRGAQADTKAGGAGLGLALAKQWAEVLGGTVAYRPADGAPGACFRLELPLK